MGHDSSASNAYHESMPAFGGLSDGRGASVTGFSGISGDFFEDMGDLSASDADGSSLADDGDVPDVQDGREPADGPEGQDEELDEDERIWENPAPLLTQSSAVIHLIWAQALSLEGTPGAIGNNNAIPWHIREDLRHFKDLTVSHPVIMGSRTWESLGAHRPLSSRDNIVVSFDEDYEAPGATVADSLDEALSLATTPAIPDDGIDRSEVWVIGGASVLRQCLQVADDAYVTQVDLRAPADTFAPDMSALVRQGSWRLVSRGRWQRSRLTPKGGGRAPRFRFLRYERVKDRAARAATRRFLTFRPWSVR